MPSKFDRCVRSVKRRGTARNAYAVCNAQLYGRRANPMGDGTKALLWILGGGAAAFLVYRVATSQPKGPAASQQPITLTTPGGQTTTIPAGASCVQLQAALENLKKVPFVNQSVIDDLTAKVAAAGCA